MSVLQELHDSEINASIQSFYDGCWTAKIGDDMNGFVAEDASLESFEDCEQWLSETAKKMFPQSVYTQKSQGSPS